VKVGDVLVEFDGRPVATWDDFSAAVRASQGTGIPLVVERDGRRVTLTVDPVEVERPVWAEDGSALVVDGELVTEHVRYVGISPTTEVRALPLGEAVPRLGEVVWENVKAIVSLPAAVVDIGRAIVGDGERAPGVVGLVGVAQVAGQVASVESPDVTLADRTATMVLLIGSLNIALFVFNLIPLLPLDGGHVAGALWEGAKRQWARMTGRPRPRPADMARMMPVAYGVFLVLIALGIFLVVADVVVPVI
jgi:membrane-associated protease RseP (regulator of RpoE activity)